MTSVCFFCITNKQTIDGSKITAKQQLTNHYNFHVLMTNRIMKKLTNPNQDQSLKYHHLTMTLHLTLRMTQVVEMSVTNNSLSKDYPHPDDHSKQIMFFSMLEQTDPKLKL